MFRKGLAVVAVPLAFQLAFLAGLWWSQGASESAQAMAIHTTRVIAQAESVVRFLTEAESAVRGLIVTGDPAAGAAYERAAARVPDELDRLHALVADNPAQQARVAAMGAVVRAFLGGLAAKAELARAGRAADAAVLVRRAVLKDTSGSIRRAIDTFLTEEERLDERRREALRRAGRRLNLSLAAGAGASVAAAVALILWFSRGFGRRVAVLDENARRVAVGEPLAPPLGGTDEVGRLDAAFHAMARALAEKNQENELFLYSVSHDLRSPLVNLQGFSKELELTCDDLREGLAGADLPEPTRRRVDELVGRDMATSVHFIRTAVNRLSAIIDSLLRLSRAGRVDYRVQAVDVAAAVGRVVASLAATAAGKGATVTVAAGLPPAWADPTAVEQVFANLVGNALNYLDPARPGRIEVAALPGSNPPTYYVKDNGLGVPRDYQAKLFRAFQRLHPGVAPGEGIGLALARRTVERLGGKVWFESNGGEGSTFLVTLPAVPVGRRGEITPTPGSAETPAPPAARTRGER